MDTNPTLDARAARVAARQLGLLTGAQARRIGFTHHEIQHRLEAGRWTSATRDVHVMGGTPHSWQRDALAACLAGPPEAVASHGTAGALWGLAAPCPLPHVTFPPTASARLRIAKVHRSALTAQDVTQIGCIPVTRVPRTLIDIASYATKAVLERAVDTALDSGLTSPIEVMAAIERSQRAPGRAGMPGLLRALAPWSDAIQPESPAEARLVRRLADWKLPVPVLQHVVRDPSGVPLARIDVAWPKALVGLEYDGVLPHGPRHVERDEGRHAAVTALGWELVHADRRDLRPGDHRLPDLLAPLLRRRLAALRGLCADAGVGGTGAQPFARGGQRVRPVRRR